MKPLDCTGCHACCIGESVIIHPECGDVPEFYETESIMDGKMLRLKQIKGRCIYLNKNGCGIYDVRPTLCKEFDCRKMVKRFGYTRIRKMVKMGMANQGVLNAAMRRMK